jgi:flagellar protein FliS
LAEGRFIKEYRKSAVQGATPLQLVIMLYDGALRYMEAGKHALAHCDREKQNSNLQKAQSVVFELVACLDTKKGGEIAANLASLYSYVLEQLVAANIKDDSEAIERALKVMSDLRESWVQIEKATRETKPQKRDAA